MSASKRLSASSPVTPETPPFVVSQHKRFASTRSTASSSVSSDVSSLPRATKKAEGHVEDGLRERAFACLVRVAARVQAFLGPDDAGECAPLAAFASRVFDDAKCTAGWRDAARALVDPAWADDLPNSPDGAAGSTAAGKGGDRPPPMFPLLAGLYAAALRGWGERDAEDARAVSWFVLKLVGRSVRSTRAASTRPRGVTRIRSKPPRPPRPRRRRRGGSETTRFARPGAAAAPPGPGAPDADDPKFLPLRDLADAIGAELAGSPKRPEASRGAALDRELNLASRRCARNSWTSRDPSPTRRREPE